MPLSIGGSWAGVSFGGIVLGPLNPALSLRKRRRRARDSLCQTQVVKLMREQATSTSTTARGYSDWPFFLCLGLIGGVYILLIVAMLLADASFTSPKHLWQALQSPEIRYSIKLSLLSCSLTALMSVWVAVPIGYLLSRHQF